MNEKFVAAFMERRGELRAKWMQERPYGYEDIVRDVVEILPAVSNWSEGPDPTRIHQIDDGGYQGTLVFVIPCKGYQPSEYWSVLVGYGSCSGCDTLQNILGYSDDPLSEQQLNDLTTLALHIVQGLRSMSDPE